MKETEKKGRGKTTKKDRNKEKKAHKKQRTQE